MKVIVAEDEYYARKSLIKMVEQYGQDMEVVGECETGKEVMETLARSGGDLVITDIRMPVMDGLELSRQIHETYSDVRVILVSGYADFAYAQQAISYHVKNYLVKPIKSDELLQAIHEVKKEVDDENIQIQQKVEQKLITDTMCYLSMKELLRNEELMDRLLREKRRLLEQQNWQMLVIQSQDVIEYEAVIEKMKELFETGLCLFSFYFKHSEEIVVFLLGEVIELQNTQYTREMNGWMERMAKKGRRLTAGKSRIYSSIKDLEHAYNDCNDAISNRLLKEKYQIYEYEDVNDIAYTIPKISELKLYESIKEYQYVNAEKELKAIFMQIRTRAISVHNLQLLIFKLYEIVNRVYADRGNYNADMKKYASYVHLGLSTFHTLEELEQNVLRVWHLVCTENQMKVDDEIVQSLMDYVETHYSCDISLNELAVQRYFMNASYLSRLFKNQTGVNFSKYLIECRIKKSKEYLKHTNLKVSDIAVRVGFNTTSHFGQTFKKCEGKTPEQYRKESI